MKLKNKVTIPDNFLDFVPVRKVEWDRDEDGKVYLLRERTQSKLMSKLINFFKTNRYFYIHLDHIGTTAWSAIDGKRSIRDIGEIMKKELDENLEELEKRLPVYFTLLHQNQFIDFA